jgi:hypothetical protein
MTDFTITADHVPEQFHRALDRLGQPVVVHYVNRHHLALL